MRRSKRMALTDMGWKSVPLHFQRSSEESAICLIWKQTYGTRYLMQDPNKRRYLHITEVYH
jgi:hypothetical protein